MIIKNYLTYGIFALIITDIIFLIGCVQQSANQTSDLSVSYHYTTEGGYYDVKIEGSKITYTHTDYEKIKEKCAQWMQQSPCWTPQDLITENAQLTNSEINSLKNLIEETKIMQLESYYGPEQGARCYSYILKIDEKEINYCSRPDGPEEPEPFRLVSKQVQDIVTQKFSTQ
jgi:hypothetical protein